MSDSLNTRTARWLLAMVVLLIVYGSLYPFALRPVDFAAPLDLLSRVTWRRSSRGDVFANVLLYLPFGVALAWSLPRSLGVVSRLVTVTLCGAALSLSVEIAQLFAVMRISSLSDVLCNTAGTAIGCTGAIVVGALAERLHASEVLKLTREPVSAALVLLWLASFLPPWLPPFDTSRWPAHWARIAGEGWPAPALATMQALGWLVVASALRTLTRPQYVWTVLLFLVLAMLTVRFTLFVAFAKSAEAAGAALALVAWPFAARLRERGFVLALFAALLAALAWRGLAPFEFTAHARAFQVVPFGDLISRGSTGFDLPRLFGKAFWYGSLVWLLVRHGTNALGAGVFVALCLLSLEFVQMWTPGSLHVPSTTDPVIALAAAIAIALFASLGAGGGADDGDERAATRRKARRR